MTTVICTVNYEKGQSGYELTIGRKYCYVESLSNIAGSLAFEKWKYPLSAKEGIKSALIIDAKMSNFFEFTNFSGKKISNGITIR